ncbi:MAG: redoxin domain-containing protein [Myxococcota bacterium]
MAALRDSAEKIAEFDVKVLYVSLDTAEKNAEFAASLKTDLPVVSDPDGRAAKSFGVLGMGGLYSRRWTFYIDAEGILRDIDKSVSPGTAGVDMVGKLEALGFAKRKTDESP